MAKGWKNVPSTNPLKKRVVDTLKRNLPCDKVTLVMQSRVHENLFRGNCLKSLGGRGNFAQLGEFAVTFIDTGDIIHRLKECDI